MRIGVRNWEMIEGSQLTATEIDDRYRKFGRDVQDSMCNILTPIIDNMIEKLEKEKMGWGEETERDVRILNGEMTEEQLYLQDAIEELLTQDSAITDWEIVQVLNKLAIKHSPIEEEIKRCTC